jgi:alpha-tubulin suppressor-like RCC1 family protein
MSTKDRFLPTLVVPERTNDVTSSATSTSNISNGGGQWGDSGECCWIDGGWSHTLAVTKCGQAYSWGCGADGRLGVGCYSDQLSPTLVRLYGDEIKKKSNDNDNDDEMEEGHLAYCLTELEPCMDHTDDPIVKVAAGYAHSTFLTQSGILYTTVGLMCDSCKHIL